ncbi:hypothetical protein N0V88_006815 [Collariella sp. IMI 366227]|nr:hypothetical protein N0V88_006815 [Collariella sp. IMI 366227]
MDRDPTSANNLLERKNILIAQVMTAFRDLVNTAAAPVDSTASTGQAAYSSLAIETGMTGIIKSTEDLLTLTRQLRELWIVGPLKAPEEQYTGRREWGGEDGGVNDEQEVLGIEKLHDGAQGLDQPYSPSVAAAVGDSMEHTESDGTAASSNAKEEQHPDSSTEEAQHPESSIADTQQQLEINITLVQRPYPDSEPPLQDPQNYDSLLDALFEDLDPVLDSAGTPTQEQAQTQVPGCSQAQDQGQDHSDGPALGVEASDAKRKSYHEEMVVTLLRGKPASGEEQKD